MRKKKSPLQIGTENSARECNEAQQAFLAAYNVCWPNVSRAARQIGLTRQSIYQWRQKYPEFDEAMKAVKDEKLDAMEQNLAEVSQERGWYHLQLPILKAMRPDVWGDRNKTQTSGEIVFEIHHSIPTPTSWLTEKEEANRLGRG